MRRSFFGLVWRFNALAIAAVSMISLVLGSYALAGLGLSLWRTKYDVQDMARVDPAPNDGTQPTQSRIDTTVAPQGFTEMAGTSLLVSPVTAKQTYDLSYASKTASSTRNLLFYDRATSESRKLLPDNTKLILGHTELRPDSATNGAARDKPPLALFLSIIDADTTGDGILNGDDKTTVMLSRFDGQQLTRFDDVKGTLNGSALTADAKEIVLMMLDGSATTAVHIDLADFKIKKQIAVAP